MKARDVKKVVKQIRTIQKQARINGRIAKRNRIAELNYMEHVA
jgi:hypothetical protein